MDTPETWKTVSTRTISETRVFRVTEKNSESDGGKVAAFYVIECPDWVNVVPVTDSGKVVLIEQYRHGTEELTLEIPGGMVDEGESPSDCASRELTEETGYEAGEMVFLGSSRPNPAIQSNRIHHFAAFGCRDKAAQAFDEHESIGVREVPIDGLNELVGSGEISHSLVLAGILLFNSHMKRRKDYKYES